MGSWRNFGGERKEEFGKILTPDELQEKLSGMNSVEGNPITTRIRASVKIRSWQGVTDENIYDDALQEVLEDKEN